MKYQYSGYDKQGQPAKGTIDAASPAEATELLARQGLFASAVKAAPVAAAGPGAFGAGKRLGLVASFLRQLSVLVDTGTPLVEAISSIQSQTDDGAWSDVLQGLRKRVEEGAQLSDAMGAYPGYFDGVCRSLVAAGESGGKLGPMLKRLSVFLRQQVKLRKTVSGALAYPCLLMCVAAGVVVAMLGFVMPRFEGLFKTLDAKLPPTTEWLMHASGLVRANWPWCVGAAVLLPIGLLAGLRTDVGSRMLERAMLTAPTLGKLTRAFATARLARVLGVLLEGRVAMTDALRLTRAATGRAAYTGLIARAEELVTRGESVSLAFGDRTLISPSVHEAIRSGERNGQLGPVLVQVADHLDEDNEMLLKSVVGLLEPLILIFLGLVVGTMAISMFLPLFDLAAAGGGQH